MPSIEPYHGGYRVRYREGGRGSPLKATQKLGTKREAIQAEADIARMLAARRSLTSRAGTRLPFDEVVTRWINARAQPEGAYSKEAGRWLLTTAKERSWLTTADLTPQEVAAWKAAKAHWNGRRGAVLRAVLRWAGEQLEQPVDPRSLVLLRPRQSQRPAPVGLLPVATVAGYEAKAAEQSASCRALVHCLSVYGWRPVTAARMTVAAVDLKAKRIDLGILKGGNAWSHPIFPATVDLLRPLLKGRKQSDPLFTAPRTGDAWGERYGIIHWWHRMNGAGGIYVLKRYAISNMRRGREPWTRALTISEIQLFTGHLTASQVLGYFRADVEDLAEIMGAAEWTRNGHGDKPGATRQAKAKS